MKGDACNNPVRRLHRGWSAVLRLRQAITIHLKCAATPAPTPHQPTTTVGSEYTYAPQEPWISLSGDELIEICAKQSVDPLKVEVGVAHLGDQFRMYNVSGRWMPATLTCVTKTTNTESTRTVRFDLPPSGAVRGPIPITVVDAAEITLELRTPSIETAEQAASLGQCDHLIGIESDAFNGENLRRLGFAQVRKISAQGDNADQTIVEGYIKGAIDKSSAEALLGAEGVKAEGEEWEIMWTGSKTTVDPAYYECRILSNIHHFPESSDHRRAAKGPPKEEWWAANVIGFLKKHGPQATDAAEN